jgi:hypothetical protein
MKLGLSLASAITYLCWLIVANLFLTAAPAEATTYNYDNSQITYRGYAFPYPPFAHGPLTGCCEDLSASVAFNFDTTITSGTFFVGGPAISSANLTANFAGLPTIPVQGFITLTLGAVTAWDLSGNYACNNNCGPSTPGAVQFTVETSTNFDVFQLAKHLHRFSGDHFRVHWFGFVLQ